ncbi:hypothetical protein GH714_043151 [Hevea brasiliensis]|uniref:K Homology domain-containing protein n=1 Tax=Hevea brasiliensis TaxID=3981 RepID=A0A6A6K3H5_HEVBR|nr:hypothetical protein GH714_043151 [Hevea brasiliensis]
MKGHTSAVICLTVGRNRLYSGSVDNTIRALMFLCGMHDAEAKPILVCSCSDNTVYLYELPTFIERGRIFSKSEVRIIQTGPGGTVQDFKFEDIHNNHAGIDSDSLKSNAYAPAEYYSHDSLRQDLNLKDRYAIQVFIDYDDVQNLLNVNILPNSKISRLPIIENGFEGAKSEEHAKESVEEPVVEDEKAESAALRPSEGFLKQQVGVLIGKGGDTIRYLQYNSGAKIQITRDADANPQSTTRPVEIIGTLSNIKKAEKLINAVIAEVGLIISRGGDAIKALRAKSGARIQLIPQHLPEGDGAKERTVRVTGDRKQIEMAREMIKDVTNQCRIELEIIMFATVLQFNMIVSAVHFAPFFWFAVSGIALPSGSDKLFSVVVMEQYMFGTTILVNQ